VELRLSAGIASAMTAPTASTIAATATAGLSPLTNVVGVV
jgi:hypothetical protein